MLKTEKKYNDDDEEDKKDVCVYVGSIDNLTQNLKFHKLV